jgi:acetyl-CoA carboxylase carboxyl transferase subunit alpha
MMENAIYSVIPPEACGSIIWRDAGKRAQAAAALKITSEDVSRMGCVDDVVSEPPGGAHNDPVVAATLLDEKLVSHLSELRAMPAEERIARRLAKFREIARFYKNA